MNDFLIVLGIASLSAFFTYLGAPLAERFDVPHRIVSAALQFAAGIITALVFFSLMPPAVQNGPAIGVVLGFFVGGTLFVLLEKYSAQVLAAKAASSATLSATSAEGPMSLGLYIGILVDLVIDGMVIGVASTLTLTTGLLLALGLAVSTMPLAFVTTAMAKRQGVSREHRRLLSYLFVVCIVGGALLGFGLLRNQPLEIRLILIALASGFLITTVTQSLIPEANREGEPGFAGVLYVGGISLYALSTLLSQ
jgi:zinc transporter, ZIP family